MKSIIINPKSEAEFILLTKLLKIMNITNTLLSEEDKEDMGMAVLLKKADRTKQVSRKAIMKKLNR